ncbi:MAG: hypothetical protein FK733_13515 [Asgard group archaeon]|nr:hypothetical protein [Asgard group archaeon]
MRAKNTFLILIIMLMLSPVLAVAGSVYQTAPVVYETNDFDSDVGVVAGDTLYYTVNQAVYPEEYGPDPSELTLPDFAGSTLYVKVMQIEDEYEFTTGVEGNKIYYATGLIFNDDKVFTIGAGLTATDIIIPAGSATPSITSGGVASWNTSYSAPTLFFINDDYAEHTMFLELLNFTVTETADNFHAILTNETSGGRIEGNWRKSYGICTHLIYDDIKFAGGDYTGVTLEITLDEVKKNPLPVTAGDVLEYKSDIIDVSITGDMLNETTLSSINDDYNDIADVYEGVGLLKYVVTGVEGCYYMCDVYMWDNWTQSYVKSDYPYVYNGFIGSFYNHDPFFYSYTPPPPTKGPSYYYFDGPGPFVTPDWGIYEGQMNLFDALLSNHVTDILELMSPAPWMTYHAIGGTMELVSKKDFKYLYALLNVNIEEDLGSSSFVSIVPEMVYDTGSIYQAQVEAYYCYHETGIGAAIRFNLDMDIEVYDEGTEYDTGLLSIDIDVKLRNHDYDPPEILGRGIMPGYNWIIALPALLSLAAIGLIRRRRK